ncbi:beta-ketoacyl-[acyl-carrier-protein] synthase family protein [Rhodanobacter sp. Col0626]|uniref:beta-ketoacyl-[acyl-carrier-protein] synthase family protein n=1 Tax=Rhodanobacter sp. Col0626 TaxID=3415679 RepID=UPI003CE8FF4D
MSADLLDARGLPRVVVTGMGVVSCLGNGRAAMLDALRNGRSGLRAMDSFAKRGLTARVGGPVDISALEEPPRKLRRFLADPALYAWHAMSEAINQAGLSAEALHEDHCGLVIGGGASLNEYESGLNAYRSKGVGRLSPFFVSRGMSSALSACLAYAFGIRGASITVSSACTSASLAIGQAMEQIQLGRLQLVLTGGSEELFEGTATWFDAMGALSPASDREPQLASRPYDLDRDGFVLAAGAGVLVLESLAHARARGANVLAELTGYGASTDPTSMVGPGADGIARALRMALDQAGSVPDYINTHACSTPLGDLEEWRAIETVFAERHLPVPPLSSIKGLGGHAPGAAGALDAIACLLMMEHGFIAAGQPARVPDPAFAAAPLVTKTHARRVDNVLSNSFGFGGSCAALMFRRMTEDTA